MNFDEIFWRGGTCDWQQLLITDFGDDLDHDLDQEIFKGTFPLQC